MSTGLVSQVRRPLMVVIIALAITSMYSAPCLDDDHHVPATSSYHFTTACTATLTPLAAVLPAVAAALPRARWIEKVGDPAGATVPHPDHVLLSVWRL